MGLYVSVVLVIGKFVRGFFSEISHSIMFEELPCVDRILKLCTDIFLVSVYRNTPTHKHTHTSFSNSTCALIPGPWDRRAGTGRGTLLEVDLPLSFPWDHDQMDTGHPQPRPETKRRIIIFLKNSADVWAALYKQTPVWVLTFAVSSWSEKWHHEEKRLTKCKRFKEPDLQSFHERALLRRHKKPFTDAGGERCVL